MPTLAIVGAGPGLGASLARRFGRDGYRVALISRNPARLTALTEQLRGAGVDAHAYPADVLQPQTLHDALTAAAKDLGGIDFLEYSPAPSQPDQAGPLAPVTATDLSIDAVSRQIEYYLYGGITAVQAVLPAMIERGTGTIVVSTGASSGPVIHPPFGNIAAATAALRNWTCTCTQPSNRKASTPPTWPSPPGSARAGPDRNPMPSPRRMPSWCTSAPTPSCSMSTRRSTNIRNVRIRVPRCMSVAALEAFTAHPVRLAAMAKCAGR